MSELEQKIEKGLRQGWDNVLDANIAMEKAQAILDVAEETERRVDRKLRLMFVCAAICGLCAAVVIAAWFA